MNVIHLVSTARPWQLSLLSVVLTSVFASGFSLLFHGRVTSDYLITGAITALAVSYLIVKLLSRHHEELRSAHTALQESRARLDGVIASAMDAIISTDDEQRIVLFNSAAETMFRCPAAQAIGQDITRFIPERFRAAHREHVRRFGETGVADRALGSLGTIRGLRADGEEFPAESSISVAHVAGQKIYTVILRDITKRMLAEKRLVEAHSLLHQIVGNLPLYVFWKDRESNYLGCNRLFAESAGVGEPAAIVGKSDYELTWRETAELYRTDDRHVMETNTPKLSFEEPQTRPDGSVLWLRTSKVPLQDRDGKVFGVLGLYEDITERKRAEETLRESQKQLREAQRIAHIGSWDLNLTTHRLAWSDEIYRIFEVDPEKFGASYETFLGAIHPDDRATVDKAYTESLRNRTPYEITHRLLLGNGRVKFVHERCETLYDADGHPIRSVGTVQDITERMRLEESSLRSARRYQDLVNSVNGIVWEADPSTFQFTFVSGRVEPLLGYPKERWLAEPTFWTDHVHPEDREWTAAFCRNATREKKNHQFEYRMIAADGRTVWLSETVTVIVENDRPVALCGVMVDVTERKRVEDKLRQTQKMESLGTLAGGIAHGFNNILTAIVGHIDLTLRASGIGDETRQDLEQAHAAATKGGALVRQIMAFSRQGHGERAPIELARLVTDTLALLRPTFPANIEVRHRSKAASTWLQADSTQVQQVLLNFFDNAAFAMRGTGGVLDLALDEIPVGDSFAAAHPPLKPGPYVRLTVRDTGCGMTPAVRARIFDPFFTTKRQGEGTGLGLAAAYGIVSDHGGVITVASEPNQGTAFEMYLPLLPKGGPPAVDAPAQPVSGGTERILFVDDEASLARLGQRCLTPLGYTVVTEVDSLAALDRFRQSPDQFDLVITDQTMPKMTGAALVAELLRIRPNLPIILYTGGGAIMPPEDLRRLGIRGFLAKPYTMSDLTALIRRVLDRQPG